MSDFDTLINGKRANKEAMHEHREKHGDSPMGRLCTREELNEYLKQYGLGQTSLDGQHGHYGVLTGAKCVVISPMEADIRRGESLRQEISGVLQPLGIEVWDHYNRPYRGNIDESSETHDLLKEYRTTGQFDKISEYRDIRPQDLALIDKCDFVICVFEKRTFSAGTLEEFFWANRLKRPIFFVWGEGKRQCPFWFFWTIPHKYIYSSVEEALNMIRKIHAGDKQIDSSRWRLMKQA